MSPACVILREIFLMISYREGNDPGDEGQITYGELLKQVCKFANVLKSLGKSELNLKGAIT